MPVPNPRPNELQKDFMSRCIGIMKQKDPDRTTAQIIAMCGSTWRRDKGMKDVAPTKQQYEFIDGRLVPNKILTV